MPIQGVCPSGWHLPNSLEWLTLYIAVGGQNNDGGPLKSASGWYGKGNGEYLYGFSAIPAGYRDEGDFGNSGFSANFWSSTVHEKYFAYDVYLSYNPVSIYLRQDFSYSGFSVRCIQD